MSDSELAQWIGRRQHAEDWIVASRVAAWNATLDIEADVPKEGDRVPAGFHWATCPPLVRESLLGPDGHARVGTFLPKIALPRRMWAGSTITFHRPMRVGDRVRRESTVAAIDEKTGRHGALVFVTVHHAYAVGDALALEEEQTIVHRPMPTGAASDPAPEPARAGAWRRAIAPTETLLFRYSAATFNAHRIHYDRRYVEQVEHYPGLLVHGPLLATLLLDLVRRERPDAEIARFRFRALRPTFDTSPFEVRGEPASEAGRVNLWSTDNEGALGMDAEAWTR